jgi:hypothetical protein
VIRFEIRVNGEARCGFCLMAPPDVAGLLVRNGSAICPQCVRVCAELRGTRERP